MIGLLGNSAACVNEIFYDAADWLLNLIKKRYANSEKCIKINGVE